jgi:2-C-methyl-D-erythritol 2,4-cyclodiphosphate synthase
MRVGHGYDIHAFGAGDGVTLGGVGIDCDVGIVAHSDGDVVLHALADAVLGGAGLGDIGRLFPDTDPAWRDADSRDLLADVVARIAYSGWIPGNVDITIIAGKPRIDPHVEQMRRVIAEVLGIRPEAVNVKATTHEGLGPIGRGEGVAAHAVAALVPL